MRNKLLKLFLAACYLLFVTFFTSEFAAAEDVLYYQCDAQGTPVAMTDAQGNVVWQGGCSPFGEDFHGTGTREPRMGYCGKLYDHQLGLYDFGARYYDPAKGRFTGVDPVTGNIADSQGLNSYTYCLNNPYKYIDPDGRITIPAGLVVYVTAVRTSPDFQSDMNSFTISSAKFVSSPSWAGAVDASLDLAGLLIPAVPGSALKVGRQAISKADDVGGMGKVVIGKFPDYLKTAESIGAKRFNIPTEIWNKMSKAEQWAANQKFIDRAIARGDEVILSNTVKNMNEVSGTFRKELEYLIRKGYILNKDGIRMIKK